MVSRGRVSETVMVRLRWVRNGFGIAIIGLLAYLFDMQVIRSDQYQAQAEMNSMRRVTIDAPRGVILDRDGRVLVKNRPAFEAIVSVDLIDDLDETLRRAKAVLGLEQDRIDALRVTLAKTPRAEISVKEDLTLAEVASIDARAHEWPEFRVKQGLVRIYPHGRVAAHALGHMGEIRRGDLGTETYAGYRMGEVIGKTGVERRYERFLRGTRGARWIQVNSLGREIRKLDHLVPPIPGKDVRLTLDLDVQIAGEEAFGEQRGSAVAIDARTGEVLAIISRPAYDPNVFAGKVSSQAWNDYRQDPNHPLLDRSLNASQPPGSVFKLVDAIAGLEDGTWNPDEKLTCNGSTVIHRDRFKCWRRGGHGDVSLYEAIRGSCNVFFYHRGDAIGIERLAHWSRRLGLGSPTGIDLDSEGAGLVPDSAWKRKTYGQPWWPGETISVAIGQGALQVSVLQLARVFEIIGSGGVAHVPYLVASVGDGEYTGKPTIDRDLELNKGTVERLHHALWAVVNEKGGTARRARIEGYHVSGKTGTAQVPASGEGPDRANEHAWFAGFAPAGKPTVIAVALVERGGHGGATAAPIVRALLERALQKQGIPPLEEAPYETAAEKTLVASTTTTPEETRGVVNIPLGALPKATFGGALFSRSSQAGPEQ